MNAKSPSFAYFGAHVQRIARKWENSNAECRLSHLVFINCQTTMKWCNMTFTIHSAGQWLKCISILVLFPFSFWFNWPNLVLCSPFDDWTSLQEFCLIKVYFCLCVRNEGLSLIKLAFFGEQNGNISLKICFMFP